MKPNLKRALVMLGVAVPLMVFWAAREAASWRPQEILRVPQAQPFIMQLSPDNHVLIAGNMLWDLQKSRVVRSLSQKEIFRSFDDADSYWCEEEIEGISTRFILSRRGLRSGNTLWHTTVERDESQYPIDVHMSPDWKDVHALYRDVLRVFDARTGRVVQKSIVASEDSFFVDNGRAVAAHYWDQSVHLTAVSLVTGKPLWNIGWNAWLDDGEMGATPDSQTVWAIGDNKSRLVFLDARTGKRLWDYPFIPDTSGNIRMAFSWDGKLVGLLNWTGLLVFDARTGRQLWSRSIPHLRQNKGIELENGGQAFYTMETDGRVLRWRLH